MKDVKVVLHLDMNSYFATLEQQANPNLRNKPVGVAGKGRGERTVIAGASIEAKKFGVRSGMSTWEARRLCPQLIIIPANYDRYIFNSRRIFALMERFSPTVEVFSIDEAFLEINSKYQIPRTWKLEIDNWKFDPIKDYQYLLASKIALQIKQTIKTQIGSQVTCSVGISYGKTLAKLASELKKPDGLTVIRPVDFPNIAETTPIEELCGIGFRLQPRLNQMGIVTIADLGRFPKTNLVKTFGESAGSWLNRIGNGIDDNILRSFRGLPREKSVGHSYTLPRDIASFDEARKVLLLLAERVGARLRKKGLMGKTVSFYVRFFDRTGWGQAEKQVEYLNDGYAIYRAGCRLSEKILQPKPIRLLSITVSDLVEQIQVSRPLFLERNRYDQLIRAIDRVNQRYGEFTVFRGQLSNLKRRIFNLPDGRNRRTYLPEINALTKRI